jgi:hypothetical protein
VRLAALLAGLCHIQMKTTHHTKKTGLVELPPNCRRIAAHDTAAVAPHGWAHSSALAWQWSGAQSDCLTAAPASALSHAGESVTQPRLQSVHSLHAIESGGRPRVSGIAVGRTNSCHPPASTCARAALSVRLRATAAGRGCRSSLALALACLVLAPGQPRAIQCLRDDADEDGQHTVQRPACVCVGGGGGTAQPWPALSSVGLGGASAGHGSARTQAGGGGGLGDAHRELEARVTLVVDGPQTHADEHRDGEGHRRARDGHHRASHAAGPRSGAHM